MDNAEAKIIHEWLGHDEVEAALGLFDSDAMACVRKLNSEDCDVLFRFLNGWVVITSPFIRVHGPTIYDAALKYLRLANNG